MEPIRVHEKRQLDGIPAGSLGIIPVTGCEKMAASIDYYLTNWRAERQSEHSGSLEYLGYQRPSYIIDCDLPRFGTGEGKGVVKQSVRGMDIYLLVDVVNFSKTYRLCGVQNHMSPDDHYQNLKRVIAAIGGKARRITVIMPYLYEGRMNARAGRESLNCAIALQELVRMGVDNIVSFDAHDPRVMNAIPLSGFDNVQPVYQFVKGLLRTVPDLQFDSDHMLVISPDEAGMKRAVYFAGLLGLDIGMFYRRKDYTRLENGMYPVVAHEFLGSDVRGKDMLIIDDMLSSGQGVTEVARGLKERGAKRVFVCATFGLFTGGLDIFDKAYQDRIIDKVLTTNLIYQRPDLLERPWYHSCDMSKYLAFLIDTLNHDQSISDLLNPAGKIQKILERYRAAQDRGEAFKI